MSLEFRFRRTHHIKENEFLDRISNLLSAMSVETPKLNKTPYPQIHSIPKRKRSARTKSSVPKFTLFQFSLPINIKNPVISNPTIIPVTEMPPIQKPKLHKLYKPKIPTFINKKPFRAPSRIEDNMVRYKKILNLTQDLIDKDSLKGWSLN